MTEADANIVEQTVRISARPETVWRYWTDPQRMCDWWGSSRTRSATRRSVSRRDGSRTGHARRVPGTLTVRTARVQLRLGADRRLLAATADTSKETAP